MFLNKIIQRNPKLIQTGVELHQKGLIPANSYVLDIDTISYNAKLMAEEGERYHLKVFAMTKQIGRNPVAIKAMVDAGIRAGVCVDMSDARPMTASGMEIGHLGHLVQVPFAETKAAAKLNPRYWMVYNLEKAKAVSEVTDSGREQNIMVRIFGEDDSFYRGHEAGFPTETILETAKEIQQMKGLHFAGIATFPAQLYDVESKTVKATHNYNTLIKTADYLRNHGYPEIEVNAPGTTSSHIFKRLVEDGVIQVEPGHGLTGTTPIHAYEDMPEMPGYIYVSEVSHFYGGKPYCYGGGMYIDPVFDDYDVQACVGRDGDDALKCRISCEMPKPKAIDYYGILNPGKEQKINVGDTVVFGFRAQMFVTRAYVVPVSGISKNEPKVEGIYFTDGRRVGWPEW